MGSNPQGAKFTLLATGLDDDDNNNNNGNNNNESTNELKVQREHTADKL